MKPIRWLTGVAFAIFATASAHAQIAIGSLAGSEISVVGLIQYDTDWYASDIVNLDSDPASGANVDYRFRRVQLFFRGIGPGNFDWVLGYDGAAKKWLDVNVVREFNGGKQFVQVGQFKQPNGLEQLSAGRFNDFMSRAMVTNTFALGRRLGAAYSVGHPFDRSAESEDEPVRRGQWGLTAAYFGRELTPNLAYGNGFGVRGTRGWLRDDDSILHFGLSYVNYDTPSDTFRLRSRPDADLTPVRLIDTGTMTNTNRVATTGFESFWVHGPFKVQGEYMSTKVSRYGAGTKDFNGTGGYVSGMWNINGQSWTYKGGEPVLVVGAATGPGMWQLGLRYDAMDLDDNTVQGGGMQTWTAGVNWYVRAHFKFVLNYVAVQSERAGVDDNPDITEARVQFYW